MLTQFEVTMVSRAVEALGRIADELSRIRSILEKNAPESPSERKERAK